MAEENIEINNLSDLSKLKEFGIGKFKNTVKPYM